MAEAGQGWFRRAVGLLAQHRKGLEVLAVIGAVVWLFSALVTLLPDPSQPPNRLGWASTCPFVPWSSLVLVAFAVGCLAAIPILRWLVRRFGPAKPDPQEGAR